MNMDEALQRFLRTSYWFKHKQNMDFQTKLAFYDAVYRVDPELFVKYVAGRIKTTNVDTVIPDVRYLNEMEALKEMGFIICRVTTNAKQLQAGKYIKTAAPGSVALSLVYDKRFSINHSANYAINWTSKASVGPVIDTFLERIGFKLDI